MSSYKDFNENNGQTSPLTPNLYYSSDQDNFYTSRDPFSLSNPPNIGSNVIYDNNTPYPNGYQFENQIIYSENPSDPQTTQSTVASVELNPIMNPIENNMPKMNLSTSTTGMHSNYTERMNSTHLNPGSGVPDGMINSTYMGNNPNYSDQGMNMAQTSIMRNEHQDPSLSSPPQYVYTFNPVTQQYYLDNSYYGQQLPNQPLPQVPSQQLVSQSSMQYYDPSAFQSYPPGTYSKPPEMNTTNTTLDPNTTSATSSTRRSSARVAQRVADMDEEESQGRGRTPSTRASARVASSSRGRTINYRNIMESINSSDSDPDDYEGNDHSDKNKVRLARKAELARASRKRKKMYVKDMEEKVKRLVAQVDELKQNQSTLKNIQSKENRKNLDAVELLQQIEHEISENSKETIQLVKDEINSLLALEKVTSLDRQQMARLKELTAKFIDVYRYRQPLCQYHVDQVDTFVKPSLQTRFAVWGLSQHDSFYTDPDDEKKKPSLWTSLMLDEIKLSQSQFEEFKSKMTEVRRERDELISIMDEVSSVKKRIADHHNRLNTLMVEVTGIYNPVQLAQYFMWTERNEWTVSMLQDFSPDPLPESSSPIPPPANSENSSNASKEKNKKI